MQTSSVVDSTAPESVAVAITRFGKDINIARMRGGRLFEIVVAGGGTKPPELSGAFTRFEEARDAIMRYDYAKPLPDEEAALKAAREVTDLPSESVDFSALSAPPAKATLSLNRKK